MKTISLLLILSVFAARSAWSSGPTRHKVQIVPEASRVEFLAVGRPSLLKIRGSSARELQANLILSDGSVSGAFQFKLETLDSGISKRDQHMKEKYLEVARFPIATMELNPVAWVLDSEQNFHGTLELHGVKRPVSGKVRFHPETPGNQYAVESSFGIRLQDFAIEIPRFAGVTVADDVMVQVSTKFEVAK